MEKFFEDDELPYDVPAILSDSNIQTIANELLVLEDQISAFKELEKRYKEQKEKLTNSMIQNNVKSWTLPNGTKFTLVEAIPDGWIERNCFDDIKFKKENPELYEKYIRQVSDFKAGRKAYVKVTVKKG